MKKMLVMVLLALLLANPVCALDLEAPEVPELGRDLMPYDTESFSEGFFSILQEALARVRPDILSALRSAGGLIAISLLISSVKLIPGSQERVSELVGIVSVSLMLLGTSGSMIRLASETVEELSAYGKLLFPVLTAGLAAQGCSVTSGALYAGTLAFDTVLSAILSSAVVPMVYIILCLSVIYAATGHELIGKMRDLCKWICTWSLKIILYIFTGYMGITGVVSGTTDAAALKATKIVISGMVPVVGGILSDSSEAVLAGAEIMKNAAGVYGLLCVLAVCIGPFLKIGTFYLLHKSAYGICSIFPIKQTNVLIKDFSGAMGILLAMTGTVCLFLMISIVCFMKGVG